MQEDFISSAFPWFRKQQSEINYGNLQLDVGAARARSRA